MKMTAFRDVAPCSSMELDRRFRRAYWDKIALIMETVRTSEMSICLHKTTFCYIPARFHFLTRESKSLL
jgi:hypothetical protein